VDNIYKREAKNLKPNHLNPFLLLPPNHGGFKVHFNSLTFLFPLLHPLLPPPSPPPPPCSPHHHQAHFKSQTLQCQSLHGELQFLGQFRQQGHRGTPCGGSHCQDLQRRGWRRRRPRGLC